MFPEVPLWAAVLVRATLSDNLSCHTFRGRCHARSSCTGSPRSARVTRAQCTSRSHRRALLCSLQWRLQHLHSRSSERQRCKQFVDSPRTSCCHQTWCVSSGSEGGCTSLLSANKRRRCRACSLLSWRMTGSEAPRIQLSQCRRSCWRLSSHSLSRNAMSYCQSGSRDLLHTCRAHMSSCSATRPSSVAPSVCLRSPSRSAPLLHSRCTAKTRSRTTPHLGAAGSQPGRMRRPAMKPNLCAGGRSSMTKSTRIQCRRRTELQKGGKG